MWNVAKPLISKEARAAFMCTKVRLGMLYLSASLVLGSYYALIPMAVYLSTLVIRITNEEKVLRAGLPGYADYAKKVRYRLIPLVW